MSGSLRRTLIFRTGLSMAAVLLLAGGLLYAFFSTDTWGRFDEELLDKATLLAATVEQSEFGVELDFAEFDSDESQFTSGPWFLQLWSEDGSSLYRSPSLAGTDLPGPGLPRDTVLHRDTILPGGGSGRMVVLAFQPRLESEEPEQWSSPRGLSPAPLTLALARDSAPVAEILTRLKFALLSALLLSVIVVAGTLASIIGSSMRPIERLATRIGLLSHRDLTVRLPAKDVQREMRPVVHRLNELLAQLEQAFEREQSLSADIAHELRTPLAGMRSTLEVALSRRRSEAEYATALTSCLEMSEQMQRLVENLLSLARLESGTITPDWQSISLKQILLAAWEPLEKMAAQRGLDVRMDLSPTCEVAGDSGLLSVALRNVLDNAVEYVDEGGTISVSVACDDAGVVRVSNTGCSWNSDEARQLCDRFRRGDPARSNTGAHCGLGLSLVHSIIALHGGEVRIDANAGGIFTISLVLPCDEPPNRS
jgi:heavy metal sensor kinase